MQTRLESAIASEVLAEIKRQRYTYKEIQARADVKPRAFSYYFIAGERAIPFPVLAAVCDALDVLPSEIIARAESSVAKTKPPADPIRDELEGKLTKRARRQVQQERDAHEGRDTDPRHLSRADEDDGRTVEALAG